MKTSLRIVLAAILAQMTQLSVGVCQDQSAVQLPAGVKAVWDMDKAYRETTPTRERICINGLWQWQPAKSRSNQPPKGNWGYFKTPGFWPGITDYMQKDTQTVYPHPSWKSENMREIRIAWYQREIEIPKNWAGRRILLTTDYLNAGATVYLDGQRVGEMLYPTGEVDLSKAAKPGVKQVVSIELIALPLADVIAQFGDSNAPKTSKATVNRRGLCGDVYLVAEPTGPRIADVRIETSTRKGEIAAHAALKDIAPNGEYALRVEISEKGKKVHEFTGKKVKGSALKDGKITAADKWTAPKLWDIHTPQNQYEALVTLVQDGKELDAAIPVRFGYREFWSDGRDFYLNGTRIWLSCVPLDNAQLGIALASYEGAKESMLRLKTFGINFVYTHNYDCNPGSFVSFAEVLRAADDAGMLVSFSQPQAGHYDWKAPDADEKNGYADLAAFLVREAQNHPSVVCYSMNHNATGYTDDMNPDMIDGLKEYRKETWSQNNAKRALRAEEIVKRLDPSRIIYHHSSGNLSSMHTSNFYPNWAPIQELCDWFEHWATKGVKPVFTCEYGAPFTWDWAMYRGWYKGVRTFGSAAVPWEFCNAEWNSQFVGDKAFQIADYEKVNLRWETKQYAAGKVWKRWDYKYQLGSRELLDQYPIFAMYLTDNWRAFRTWGMSINSPWEAGHFWLMRKGLDKSRKDYKVDWDRLQRPGFSPDYEAERYERMDLAYNRSDWIPSEAGQSLLRNNMPLLAYIAGKKEAFTSKDHNFLPGETVEKQLVVINNSREPVSCECSIAMKLPKPVSGNKSFKIETGRQERMPLKFKLPDDLPPGRYDIDATVKFSTGETQKDTFSIHAMAAPSAGAPAAKIALFDPKGDTGKLLDSLGFKAEPVKSGAKLDGFDVLVVGRGAITLTGPGLKLDDVPKGLKVVVFEQTPEVLEQRFGFRIAEYGLRNVFKRVADHPLLTGIEADNLRDWRGEATTLEPRLKTQTDGKIFGGSPFVYWCGIPVTRGWRCGNRGCVAGALIEKPACGNFLPIVDGGFSLQYSPLMEYREGRGMVLFCQMDVTGRTENDPAAERLTRNIINYVSDWKPAPSRKALYAGDAKGKSYLEKLGVAVGDYQGGKLSDDMVLVVGPGGGKQLASDAAALSAWLKKDGRLLAVGLDADDLKAILPKVSVKKGEHIAAYFETFGMKSPFAGVGSADVHNRDPKDYPLVTGGATVVGDGILASVGQGDAVICGMAPWQFDNYAKQYNLKRTFRRTACLVSRLLGNMNVESTTPILARFNSPVKKDKDKPEQRWLDGLYLDQPEEWDDPYRFFRW